ncbi:hypothetical protein COEREDRAFT_89799 [Coemansia reversa NRRL 1564]|uniref:Uncharacterized protein n=1 Tax=Coemansia reversa (strain ATCC 12441 / NRRL 1564) TaxID=763665 RepID=A0A2G5B2B8_COERN|nr:hypothetical protein COEREDRAFT_89799 [Coemansia reversa NRRL 1564]|eukprot:PIA13160.1 hypothetical protein COEREDRAFT_89799 [Coemansia reversa NRRL 1564]
MGVLQRDRRGTRALKQPIPVLKRWMERIEYDHSKPHQTEEDENCVSKEESQLMERLDSLTSELANTAATWLEQSKWLKEIEHQLSALKKLPEVCLSTLSYLRTVAIPMFVECFFLPNEGTVRRQIIPIIKALSALDPSCVDSAIQANLLAYIGAQPCYQELLEQQLEKAGIAADPEAIEIYDAQPVGHHAHAVEVLVDMPLGMAVVRRYVSDVLVYAAKALEASLPRLCGEAGSNQKQQQAMGSAELVLLRENCTQVIRLVFLCLSRAAVDNDNSVGNVDSLQTTILASMRTPLPEYVEQTLARIYALCWVLIGCESAALNSRQVAAMVLVALIEGAGLSHTGRAKALAARMLDIQVRAHKDNSSIENETTQQYQQVEEQPVAGYLSVADDSPSRRRCMDDAVSMICIARAIVSLAPYETTLTTLDIVPSAKGPGECNNVHEAVFTHIASICGRSQLAPGVKVIVFESMAIWLQETAKLLQRCLTAMDSADGIVGADSETRAFNHGAFALGQRVLVLQRERIMGYLWSYWDDPIDAVQVRVKSIFEAFLDIGSAMNQAIVADPSVADSAIAMAEASGVMASSATASHAVREDSSAFLNDVLELVMTMDWSCKVKYPLLAALSTRIDVLDLMHRQPDILNSCLDTMAEITMASRAAQLLCALIERAAEAINELRKGSGSEEGVVDNNEQPDVLQQNETAVLNLERQFIALWAKPVVAALCRDETSRRMLSQLMLSRLLESLPRIVHVMLAELTVSAAPSAASDSATALQQQQQQQTADSSRQHALIIVLRVARAQDIVTIESVVTAADADEDVPQGNLIAMLEQAAYHPDWTVRADMLRLLCEARKLSVAPSDIELSLLFRLLRVSLNATSADFRQQQFGALTVLAQRLATAASHARRIVQTGRALVPSQRTRHREQRRRELALRRGRAEGKTEEQVLRELGVVPDAELVREAKCTAVRVERAVNQWLELAVRSCLYPGAGFAKVAMGLRWLDILTTFFTPGREAPAPVSASAPFSAAALGPPNFLQSMDDGGAAAFAGKDGLHTGVTAAEVLTVLTQVLIDDPFETNRASAFALLMDWPLDSESDSAQAATQQWAEGLLRRALQLATSTRAGESESGALIIRWLFGKLVVRQGLSLNAAAESQGLKDPSSSSDGSADSGNCALAFAEGLLRRIRHEQKQAATHGLLEAAQHHPLHGLLTAAQYVVAEIDFGSRDVQAHCEAWGLWIAALLQTADDITSAVIGMLAGASPEGSLPMALGETLPDAVLEAADDDGADDGDLLGGVTGIGDVGPRQQVILSYCWRAIKEVAGLLAAVATCAPGSDQTSQSRGDADSGDGGHRVIIEAATVGRIGAELHRLLTTIRHRGAFSAVHPAFTLVCGRMMRSSDASLNQQVRQWLEQCLDGVAIGRVSVTRRSAGWPLCLQSILTCNKLATQAMLPRAMERLLALAADLHTDASSDSNDAHDDTVDLPQVHAINMLRALLDDRALGTDIVPYIEHAFVIALTGLRSRRWAIRNVCSLLFAALTRRVFGNSRAREDTAYGSITGRELFTRFPGLHPFLTNQLEDAVDRLAEADMADACCSPSSAPSTGEAENAEGADPIGVVVRTGARHIHPALYPCLILLARLQPSLIDASSGHKDASQSHTNSGDGNNGLDAAGDAGRRRVRSPSVAAETIGVVAASPHSESATGAVAPPMNLDKEPLTRVNERNSTVHVTSASTMLSMYSFTELVEMCVDSPVYKTREMAARAFAPLIPSDQATTTVVSLLRSIAESGDRMSTNSCHGILCQTHELLRVHWRVDDNGGHGGGTAEHMRKAFVSHVLPALTALWPVIIQSIGHHHHHHHKGVVAGADKDSLHGGENSSGFDMSDIVRHKYLCIINAFVTRGERWLYNQHSDGESPSRSSRLLLSRFRITMLYGSLHPLFTSSHALAHMSFPQTPGAYGTILELVKLFLACVDDRTLAVVCEDGSVQLRIDGELLDKHGSSMPPAPGSSSEVLYNPWPVLSNVLASSCFYEAKIEVLEWLQDHAANGRMDIFDRIGIDNLLPYLIVDTRTPPPRTSLSAASLSSATASVEGEMRPSHDPLVRAAAVRLLALLCTKLDIDSCVLPVHDLLAYWDNIVDQLASRVFCPLSVSTALVEFQAALVHMVYQYSVRISEVEGNGVIEGFYRRKLAWAKQLYSWTDPERAMPYRQAVSKAVITYSAIKRYYGASTQSLPALSSLSAGDDGSSTCATLDSASDEIIRLCYWRLLQDDDEEIREYMACSISQRLGIQLACDQACEKLVADFIPLAQAPFPRAYVENRVAYLLGLGSDCTEQNLSEVAIDELVLAVINPDNSQLFEHEHPNVYIDEPRNLQLAYYSLVTVADIFFSAARLQQQHARESSSSFQLSKSLMELAAWAMRCVDALDTTRTVLTESNGLALGSRVELAGVMGATSLPSLFSHLQSWILGARLTLFVGSQLGESMSRHAFEIVHRVHSVANKWLHESATLQPLHPWIARALRLLLELAAASIDPLAEDVRVRPISKDKAISDLFLLTYV